MIRTVQDVRRALDGYPDDMPITLWDGGSREYRAPFIMEEDSTPSLEPVGNHEPVNIVNVRIVPDNALA